MDFDASTIESNLRRHVDCLAALIGPRALNLPGTIDPAIGYIRKTWERMGWSVRKESYDALGEVATNLIIEQPGSTRADEIVLLGVFAYRPPNRSLRCVRV
jgi:hypothetical protein